jgi:rhomboid family GlyGly-CTERM serine protease
MKPTRETSDLGSHAFFLGLAAVAVLLALSPPEVFRTLVYDRRAILAGEAWRVLTGSLVHAGAAHLGLNLAGMALCWTAFGPRLSGRSWLLASLAAGLGSSLGVLLLAPQVRAMAGLSGLLHGLMAAGAVAAIRSGERLGWLFLALLALKVGWEQMAGPLASSTLALGAPIAVSAHLHGLLSGAAAGLALPHRPKSSRD